MGTLDVHAIVDNARFGRFHWMVMLWCALLLIFDGYDLFIYGVVLTVIMREWGDATTGRGAGQLCLVRHDVRGTGVRQLCCQHHAARVYRGVACSGLSAA